MVATSQIRRQTINTEVDARVVIADDHEIVREGIRRILARMRPKWEICGEAENGGQTVELVKSLKPDVVVLDITMPTISGLEAARQIAKLNSGCRILIFTVHDSDWLKSEIQKTGAHGYVQKSQVARDLVTAIERLLEGGTFFEEHAGGEHHPETNLTEQPKEPENQDQ